MGDKQDLTNQVVSQVLDSGMVFGVVQDTAKGIASGAGQDGSTVLGMCQKFNNMVSGIPLVGECLDKFKELIQPIVPAIAGIAGTGVNVGVQVASAVAPVVGSVAGSLVASQVKGADPNLGSNIGKLGGTVGGGALSGLNSTLTQGTMDLVTGLLQPGQKGASAGEITKILAQNAKENGGKRIDPNKIDAIATPLAAILKNVNVSPEQLKGLVEKAMKKPSMDPGDAALSVGTTPPIVPQQKSVETKPASSGYSGPKQESSEERPSSPTPGKH